MRALFLTCKGLLLTVSSQDTHTHTHTHTQSKRERKISYISSYKDTNHWIRAPSLWFYLTFLTPLGLIKCGHIEELGLPTYDLGETQTFSPWQIILTSTLATRLETDFSHILLVQFEFFLKVCSKLCFFPPSKYFLLCYAFSIQIQWSL